MTRTSRGGSPRILAVAARAPAYSTTAGGTQHERRHVAAGRPAHGRVSSAARWGRARMDLAREQRMKRVVTGHDPTGKSVFASEGEPPRRVAQAATGLEIAEIWSTDDVPRIPVASGDPTVARHQ